MHDLARPLAALRLLEAGGERRAEAQEQPVGAADHGVLLVHDDRDAGAAARRRAAARSDSRRSRRRSPAATPLRAAARDSHEPLRQRRERARHRHRRAARRASRSGCGASPPPARPRSARRRADRWRHARSSRAAISASRSASAGKRWPPVPPATRSAIVAKPASGLGAATAWRGTTVDALLGASGATAPAGSPSSPPTESSAEPP